MITLLAPALVTLLSLQPATPTPDTTGGQAPQAGAEGPPGAATPADPPATDEPAANPPATEPGAVEARPGPEPVSVSAAGGAADAGASETIPTPATTPPAAEPPPQADTKAEAAPTAPPAEEAKPGPTFEPGAHAFLRGEGRINPDLGAGAAQDQGAILSRIRLQLRAMWGPVAVFAQVQDARTFGFEAGTAANSANTDLHQGYLQLGGKKGRVDGWVRAGRQEIVYGTERLIGPLGWMPNARSFDAIRMHGELDKRFYVDGMFAILAPVRTVTATPADPMDPPLTAKSAGTQLAGLMFGARVHEAFAAELLGLFIREDAKDEALNFDRKIASVGPHIWGKPVKGLSYDAEGHVQFGRFNGRQHLAWAAAANVQYVYDAGKVKPGVAVGYAIASGDTCTGDPTMGEACNSAKSTEFFNFFPTNHKFYGLVDLFGWRNMRDLQAGLILGIPKVLTLKPTYHFFQLQNPEGRWSNAGGATVGQGWLVGNTDNNLGHEIDVLFVSKPWKPLMIQPGYGVFIPVGAGKAIAGPDPQHYIYLWLTATI